MLKVFESYLGNILMSDTGIHFSLILARITIVSLTLLRREHQDKPKYVNGVE